MNGLFFIVYLTIDTGDAELTPCSDGSYCCGSGNETCCELGLGYAIVNGEVIPAASANLTTPSHKSMLGTGLGAGLGGGLPLLAAIVALTVVLRRKKKKNEGEKSAVAELQESLARTPYRSVPLFTSTNSYLCLCIHLMLSNDNYISFSIKFLRNLLQTSPQCTIFYLRF